MSVRAVAPFGGPVRKQFGRDGPGTVTALGVALRFGGPARPGIGMGSVGEFGSVGPGKARCDSSKCRNEIKQLTVRGPDIARGPSVAIDG